MLIVHPLALWHCLKLKPEIVHFHNAELLPIALILKLLGKKIIYDVHENVRKQWFAKKFNTSLILQFFFKIFDNIAQQNFNLIFAEKSYLETYQHLAKASEVIYNYPDLDFFEPFFQQRIFPPQGKPVEFFYIGQISLARGIDTLIEGLAILDKTHPNFIMHLVGGFEFDIANLADISGLKGYNQVKNRLRFYGKSDPAKAFELTERCLAGVAILKSVGDFPGSYPTKVFEYMALGMPVITSDFELYKPIIDNHACGFCIDPLNPTMLADKLSWLIENPQSAYTMGINGRLAVQNYYAWQQEEIKLLAFYERVLGNDSNNFQPITLAETVKSNL